MIQRGQSLDGITPILRLLRPRGAWKTSTYIHSQTSKASSSTVAAEQARVREGTHLDQAGARAKSVEVMALGTGKGC
jgi:hypothetical protein